MIIGCMELERDCCQSCHDEADQGFSDALFEGTGVPPNRRGVASKIELRICCAVPNEYTRDEIAKAAKWSRGRRRQLHEALRGE